MKLMTIQTIKGTENMQLVESTDVNTIHEDNDSLTLTEGQWENLLKIILRRAR